MLENVPDASASLREGPPRSRVKTNWPVRASEQARGMAGPLHASKDPHRRSWAADVGREAPASSVRGECAATSTGAYRSAGREPHEAGLRAGSEG